jgi:hypothetical protein
MDTAPLPQRLTHATLQFINNDIAIGKSLTLCLPVGRGGELQSGMKGK